MKRSFSLLAVVFAMGVSDGTGRRLNQGHWLDLGLDVRRQAYGNRRRMREKVHRRRNEAGVC